MATWTTETFERLPRLQPLARGQQRADFESVQAYLERYGYLKEGSYVEGTLDDATADALELFQARHGLRGTGEFTAETRAQMSAHRCGLPDADSGVAFSTSCSWRTPLLTWAFEDGTADTRGELDAVRRAFETWAGAAPVTFAQVGTDQNPDVVVDWRPATDPDYSMVGGTLAHADFPPACGVVTNELPKPVHFDDSEHTWSIGAQSGAFDVETVALHEIGHILGLQHSSVSGSVMWPSTSDDSTNRALSNDDRSGIASLYPANAVAAGTYTIRQESSGRFLDAHQHSGADFSVVTRTAQDNDTQRWDVTPVGGVYVIRHKCNGRYVDAHHESYAPWEVVTRPEQGNDTQRFVVLPVAGELSTYTIQQLSSQRYLDAYQSGADFSVVTRTAQNNDTQRWIIAPEGNHTHTIVQKSSGRFMDAHEHAGEDFSVVTRTAQNNDSQRWIVGRVGIVCTIQQHSSSRFIDAYEHSGPDFSAVTRAAQHDQSQLWVLMPAKGGTFTVQHLRNGRFLDAHEHSGADFSVVTRTAQDNDTQRWRFEPA